MSAEEQNKEDSVKEAVTAVEVLLEQSRSRFPQDLPLHHPQRLNAWRTGTKELPIPQPSPTPPDNPLARTLEINRAYAEALLVQEQLHHLNFETARRNELIQRALGILPASETARLLEIHSCPALMPRNIADSTEKLLSAYELGARLVGEASAFAYIMFVISGLRARTEFEQYGKKLDTLFEQIITAPAVQQALALTSLTGRSAGFEPQFRLLLTVREKLWELKPSRVGPSGFLLTKVIDAYLSDRPNAGNALGLTILDGIIISKLGFKAGYIFESGTISIETLMDYRSAYWNPVKPEPLSLTPMLTGKRLSIGELIGLSSASIAKSCLSSNHLEKAIENYRRVLELIPDSTETYAELALCHLRNNMPEKAIAILQNGLKIAPNSDTLYHVLGNAYALANDWQGAISAYRKALEISPKFPEAWYNMGLAYEKMGTPNQAVTALHRAIEFKPDYTDAYLALGNLHLEQHHLNEAITCYQQALELNPKLVPAYYNLGRAYYELNDLDSAIQSYQKAIALNPKHAGAWYNLGIALRDKGLKEKAVEALEQAIALNPMLIR